MAQIALVLTRAPCRRRATSRLPTWSPRSARPNSVIVGANDPDTMFLHTDECRGSRRRPSPPTRPSSWPGSRARRSAAHRRRHLPLFTNDYEWDLLLQKSGWSEAEVAPDRAGSPRWGGRRHRRPRRHIHPRRRRPETARSTRPASATPSAGFLTARAQRRSEPRTRRSAGLPSRSWCSRPPAPGTGPGTARASRPFTAGCVRRRAGLPRSARPSARAARLKLHG